MVCLVSTCSGKNDTDQEPEGLFGYNSPSLVHAIGIEKKVSNTK